MNSTGKGVRRRGLAIYVIVVLFTGSLCYQMAEAVTSSLFWPEDGNKTLEVNEQVVTRQQTIGIDIKRLDGLQVGDEVDLFLFPDMHLLMKVVFRGMDQLGNSIITAQAVEEGDSSLLLTFSPYSLAGEFKIEGVQYIIRQDKSGLYHVLELREGVLAVGQDHRKADVTLESSPNESFRDDVITLTNLERAVFSMENLTRQEQLSLSAQNHSVDMGEKNFTGHTGSNGSSPFERMEAVGYQGSVMSENVAAGQKSAREVVQAWMTSPGHRANILDPRVCEIGVGYFYASNSRYKTYWTQNFGRPTNKFGDYQCRGNQLLTKAPTAVVATGATLQGLVSVPESFGQRVYLAFEISESPQFFYDETVQVRIETIEGSLEPGVKDVSVVKSIKALKPETRYYYRLANTIPPDYVGSMAGYSGNTISFTTPSVSILGAMNMLLNQEE